MELLLIPRPGDRERLLEHITQMKTFSLAELVDAYNASQRIGITGNQFQGVYLLGMHKVFLDSFGKSPIEWTNNILLKLTRSIEVSGDRWEYVDTCEIE
jgi:hypothetical protein